MTRDKFPEKIPFRLTRMLINAMEVTGIEGTYRSTCESVMRVLRNRDVSLSLLVYSCLYLLVLTHWHNTCWADWPAQAGSNRKAGRGKSMKLKLLLLYSIHTT